MHAYTGVGIVRGSAADAEWAELDLKLRQVTAGALLLAGGGGGQGAALAETAAPTAAASLTAPTRPASPFHALPNANACWAALIVEELCRLGVTTFAVAPGSRSSPLALAAARHPRARLRVGLDERSLGFWAVGFGRAARHPVAVITSSGTAVANLLPAAVEAALSHVPMILLTADRPSELRATGANQAIDHQAGVFGAYARWAHDLAPPCAEVPGRSALSVVDLAVRAALGAAGLAGGAGAGGAGAGAVGAGGAGPPPGPVHLNVQLREPLAPHARPWDSRAMLAGLDRWMASGEPLTASFAAGAGGGAWWAADAAAAAASWPLPPPPPPHLAPVLRALRGARRGLLVVGELAGPEDARAAAELARLLGWPVAADVLSGMRVGARAAAADGGGDGGGGGNGGGPLLAPAALLSHFDQVLLPPPPPPGAGGGGGGAYGSQAAWWDALRPDVVLQLGAHLTSKRLSQFLERAAMGGQGDEEGAGAGAGASSSSSFGSGAVAPPPLALWVHVAPHAERHDPAFLVTYRVVASPQDLCGAVAAAAWAAASSAASSAALASSPDTVASSSPSAAAAAAAVPPLSDYARLLAALDRAAGAAIDSELAEMAAGWADEAACGVAPSEAAPAPNSGPVPALCEAHVARVVSAELPPGHGLYLGNSMPIRDMDMFAAPRPATGRGSSVGGGVGQGGGGSAASVAGAASASAAAAGGRSPGSTFEEDDLARADSDAEMLAALTSNRPPSPVAAPSSPAAPTAAAVPSPSSLAAYAAPPPPPAAAAPFAGAPVGANRGASGIDGVLSSAAGFAAGLRSPATLVVGDLSFLHDTNGLALLRGGGGGGGDGGGEPLTVVVVNNGGGGIFSFLPVASAVDRESFERLWATPQHADLGALCRAHGVPHQRVGGGSGGGGARAGSGGGGGGGGGGGRGAGATASPAALSAALAAAWGLGRHSVIEVFPTATREGNVELHRRVQKRVQRAVSAAHGALTAGGRGGVVASAPPSPSQSPPADSAFPALAPPLRVRSALVSRYELPLTRSLTTSDGADPGVRRGALLRIELEEGEEEEEAATAAAAGSGGSGGGVHAATAPTAAPPAVAALFAGVGDAAPLPGLHRETLEQACAQLELLAASLPGRPVPREAGALLPHGCSPLEGWLRRAAAVLPPPPPAGGSAARAPQLLPSVAFALEGALLTALASARARGGAGDGRGGAGDGRGCGRPSPDVASLLAPMPPPPTAAADNLSAAAPAAFGPLVCALLSPKPGTPPAQVAASAAALLAATGAGALKVKVGRPGSDPAAEGAALGLVRLAVGPRAALRADANRAWSLADAARFCRAARDAGAELEYVEEPTRAGPAQWRALRRAVERDGKGAGPPLAADESVDDGSLEAAWRGEALGGVTAAVAASYAEEEAEEEREAAGEGWEQEDGDGWEGPDDDDEAAGGRRASRMLLPGDVAAVVLKPSLLGGVSATWRAARRARLAQGVGKVVVSSAFESAAGVALLAHLAAALDAALPRPPPRGAPASSSSSASATSAVAHGLGTLEWFAEDVVSPAFGSATPLPLEIVAGADSAAGMSLARASAVLAEAAGGGGIGSGSSSGSSGSGSSGSVVRDWRPRVSERVLRCAACGPFGAAYDARVVEVLPPSPPPPPSLLGASSAAPSPAAPAAANRRPVVLLHGFLGDAREWLPLARALASAGHPCLALDLPGHGKTMPAAVAPAGDDERPYSLPAAAALARDAARQWAATLPAAAGGGPGQRPLLVGYSLGGRVALQALADMAAAAVEVDPLAHGNGNGNGNGSTAAALAPLPWAAAVALLSASPGIRAEDQRQQRAARDDELADTLEAGGLAAFVDAWYDGPLWAPLRQHGAFARVKARRAAAAVAAAPTAAAGGGEAGERGGGEGGGGGGGGPERELARALRGMSAGRMQPLWLEASAAAAPRGRRPRLPMLLVAGAEDAKFVSIHRQLSAARRRAAAAAAAAAATGAAAAAGVGTAGRAGRADGAPLGVPDMSVEVPGAGHSVHLEAPTAVLGALLAFLDRLGEGGA